MTSFRIATITLNPAYDLFGTCPEIHLGEVNRVQTTGLIAAGKGLNVAKVLHDLGLKPIVSGLLGADNRSGFDNMLAEFDFKDDFYSVAGSTRINIKMTDQQQQVTDFNFSGFTISVNDWQQFAEQSLALLAGYNMVSVNGSLPAGIELPEFTAWLIALKQGCPKIVLDSSQAGLTAGLNAKPWLIKPNENELAEWAGRPLTSQAAVIDAAKTLVNTGIDNVVVSLGADGALWVTQSQIWQAKPPVCRVISTVGAGDSMVAGLMYGSLLKLGESETLKLASALAALSVGQNGVGLAHRQPLIDMMGKVTVRLLNENEKE